MREPTDRTGEEATREAWLVLSRDRAAHLAFLRRRLPVGADAEDLLQLAWMQAARHLDGLRAREQLQAWFWRILRNTLAEEQRRSNRQRRLLSELSHETGPAEQEEICSCSLSVLDRMPPDYRDVLRRADLDQEPMQAVAAELGISVNNASVRLHRARKAMREAMRGHCGTDSLRSCQDCACEDDASR